VLLVVGSAVLGAAIWAAWDKPSFIAFIRLTEDEGLRTKLAELADITVLNRTIYVIIVAVAFMLFASFLGYRGARRESRYLLIYYAMLLLTFLLMEIAAGCLAAAYAYNAEDEIKANMKDSLKQYKADEPLKINHTLSRIWDTTMNYFKCCGAENYEEFYGILKSKTIPKSCCFYGIIRREKGIACNAPPDNDYSLPGCYYKILSLIMQKINIAIGIFSGLVLSQSSGIILAVLLCQSILIRNLKCLPAHVNETEDGC
jgi:hypothetical protein